MTESGHPGVSRAIQQGPDRVKSSQTGPEKSQIQSISGQKDPKDPGTRVPGSIQHCPWMARDSLWLPGSHSRRYSNWRRTTVLWVLLARRETGPLSPGGCLFLLHCTARMHDTDWQGVGNRQGVPRTERYGGCGPMGQLLPGVPTLPPCPVLHCPVLHCPVQHTVRYNTIRNNTVQSTE